MKHFIKQTIKAFVPDRLRPVVIKYARRILYYGRSYYCPVCNSNTRLQKSLGFAFPVIKEKQIIGGGLRNVLCPVCNSSDRVRLLYLFLINKTNVFSGKLKLMHIAPEPSLEQLFKQQPGIEYLSADLNKEKAMVKMDITQIQYPDETFDGIICNHVLEHIPDDTRAMQEIFRVLKTGGWAILQVPISKLLETTFEDFSITKPKERERVFGQNDHVRIYGQDYIARLKNAGFKVLDYKWDTDSGLEYNFSKINLNPDESVFYCTKANKKAGE